MKKKSRKRGRPKPLPPPPPSDEILLESPSAIIDNAVADAARTLSRAASGGEVTREELAAAQDILNRKGITFSGAKSPQISEAFARKAFDAVFYMLGFDPIRWPSSTKEKPPTKKEKEKSDTDAFNKALQEA